MEELEYGMTESGDLKLYRAAVNEGDWETVQRLEEGDLSFEYVRQ